MFTPVERQGAADAVFEQVADEIVAGNLAPGQTLPAERALAQSLSVSRPALREALQRLAQAGLVHIRQGGGTRVTDWDTQAGLDLLPRLLFRRDGSLNADVVQSIFEMREVLGVDAARLCAQRADTAVVAAIQQTAADLTPAVPLTQRATQCLQLWRQIIAGSGNVAYKMAFNSMNAAYLPALPVVAELLSEELRDTAAHQNLATAIAQRDPTAAQLAARVVLSRSSQRRDEALAAIRTTQSEEA
ncbi:GntR family transcriptional regulator [Candidatus Nanopelagicales bacterium]|nr:GntR family transcriptional regulator [Candidatus Nanopelagicales bacterium]